MSWQREIKLLNLLLLVGTAFLLVAIIRIWWGGSMPSQAPSAKGPEVPVAPILRNQQVLTDFKVVAAKSLFSQDRSEPAGGVAKVRNSLEGRELMGIMIIGDTKAAILGGKPLGVTRGTPEIEAVYLGEEWDGLKVIDISNDSVTFTGKDGPRTLKFPE